MQHKMPPPMPESEQTPEMLGKWEMIEAEFINSATHVALLPNNRIFIYGGSSLDRDQFESPTFPYLFRGERPVITGHPAEIAHKQTFRLTVDNTANIHQVVLMRPEVLTHVTNTDQRLLELEFKAVDDEQLEIQGPPSAAHMPRGYCLLFILNQRGVPSVGKFVKVC